LRIALLLLLCSAPLLAAPGVSLDTDGSDDGYSPRSGTTIDLLVTIDPGPAGLRADELKIKLTATGANFEPAILPPVDEPESGLYRSPFTVRVPMGVTAGEAFKVKAEISGKNEAGDAIQLSGEGDVYAISALGGAMVVPGFDEPGLLKLKKASLKTLPAKAGKRNRLVLELELTGTEYHVYGSGADASIGIPMQAGLVPNGAQRAWLDRGQITPPGMEFHGTFTVELPITPTREGKVETRLRLLWQACDASSCLETQVIYLPVSFEVAAGDGSPIEDPESGVASGQAAADEEGLAGKSIWVLFGLAFLAGLLALAMPCTYPLIPITISFFTKQGEARDGKVVGLALAYGGGIVAVFAGIGAIVGLTTVSGEDILDIATNAWVNGLFAALFLVFGLSLIGLFEIRLPRAFDDLAMKAGGGGGYMSVFAMGTTLVITSFTCTAPFIGSLLVYAAASGDWMRVTMTMGMFGLTMAVPFVILSLSPKALQSMPRSGIWMKHLKVVLGIVELGLVLKFLSNVDLAIGTRWIHRELFLGLWALSFLAAGVYLMDLPALFSKERKWEMGKGTAIAIIFFLGVTGFLSTGLNGEPFPRSAKYLEAFLPNWTPAYDKTFVAVVYEDYDKGIALAQEKDVPVFLHFTGFQ